MYHLQIQIKPRGRFETYKELIAGRFEPVAFESRCDAIEAAKKLDSEAKERNADSHRRYRYQFVIA